MLQDFLRENHDKTAADMPKPTVAMLQQKRSETEGKIKSAVAPLLPPVPAGQDPLPLVHVWDFPDIPEPILASSGGTGKALTWLSDSWPSLVMLGLAAVAILIARSALQGGGSGSPKDFNEGFGLELPTPPKEEQDAESDDKEGMQITGGSLKDELFHIVDKNPEVAANVLRSWISENAA
jgi:flagellar M-ring protein FliF